MATASQPSRWRARPCHRGLTSAPMPVKRRIDMSVTVSE